MLLVTPQEAEGAQFYMQFSLASQWSLYICHKAEGCRNVLWDFFFEYLLLSRVSGWLVFDGRDPSRCGQPLSFKHELFARRWVRVLPSESSPALPHTDVWNSHFVVIVVSWTEQPKEWSLRFLLLHLYTFGKVLKPCVASETRPVGVFRRSDSAVCAQPWAACRFEGPTTATGVSVPVVGVNRANLTTTEQEVFITQKQLLLQTLTQLMHSSS